MEPPFDTTILLRAFSKLPAWKVLAFGLSISERMIPNYGLFSKDENVSVPGVFRSALDAAWSSLEGGAIHGDLLLLAGECENAAPETEEFSSLHVSAALDAAVSLGLLLRFVVDKDIQHVAEVASLARDTVDLYVQEVQKFPSTSPDIENLILKHPLMQQELVRQKEDLLFISQASDDRKLAGVIFREKWFSNREARLMLQWEPYEKS